MSLLLSQFWAYRWASPYLAFGWALKIQTQVLMLMPSALYPASPLSSPWISSLISDLYFFLCLNEDMTAPTAWECMQIKPCPCLSLHKYLGHSEFQPMIARPLFLYLYGSWLCEVDIAYGTWEAVNADAALFTWLASGIPVQASLLETDQWVGIPTFTASQTPAFLSRSFLQQIGYEDYWMPSRCRLFLLSSFSLTLAFRKLLRGTGIWVLPWLQTVSLLRDLPSNATMAWILTLSIWALSHSIKPILSW